MCVEILEVREPRTFVDWRRRDPETKWLHLESQVIKDELAASTAELESLEEQTGRGSWVQQHLTRLRLFGAYMESHTPVSFPPSGLKNVEKADLDRLTIYFKKVKESGAMLEGESCDMCVGGRRESWRDDDSLAIAGKAPTTPYLPLPNHPLIFSCADEPPTHLACRSGPISWISTIVRSVSRMDSRLALAIESEVVGIGIIHH